MKKILAQLRQAYPQLCFRSGEQFAWSPETSEIFYVPGKSAVEPGIWSLLHETGHALLGHTTYQTDMQLLRLEVAAWDKARELAQELAIAIEEDHIQDCLDTYRNWLHARSMCPTCTTKSLQLDDPSRYRCHSCHTVWKVTPARFARPYRALHPSQPPVVFAAEI